MIADMQRLETAARMTMGDFEGPSALPLRQPISTGLLLPAYLILAFLAATLLVFVLL